MNLPFRTGFIAAPAVLLFAGLGLNAQFSSATQTNSATRVAAEMTKGRLNPAESKPGDIVSVRLKDDLKSNGNVVLKKGTTITGVVRNVKCADANTFSIVDAKAQTRSLIEIEWLTPASDGRAIAKISIALQSVTQPSRVFTMRRTSKVRTMIRVSLQEYRRALPGDRCETPAALVLLEKLLLLPPTQRC